MGKKYDVCTATIIVPVTFELRVGMKHTDDLATQTKEFAELLAETVFNELGEVISADREYAVLKMHARVTDAKFDRDVELTDDEVPFLDNFTNTK